MSDLEQLWLSDAELNERAWAELEHYRCWALESFSAPVPEPSWPALAEVRRRTYQRRVLPHLERMQQLPVVERN